MTESKLSYLLTRFTPEQRQELCTRLGIGTDTFYRRRNDPGTFTLDDAVILDQYLQELSGEPVDTYRLFREVVEVPSLGARVKAETSTAA
jgi:hypothetical protein